MRRTMARPARSVQSNIGFVAVIRCGEGHFRTMYAPEDVQDFDSIVVCMRAMRPALETHDLIQPFRAGWVFCAKSDFSSIF